MKQIFAILSIFTMIVMCSCANLENKAVALNSAIDGAKVETAGSANTGTALPNLLFGEVITHIATVPVVDKTDAKSSQPLYMKSSRNSFFGSLFGVDNKTETITYIGSVGESAEETQKRVNSLKELSSPKTESNSK